MQSMLTWLTMLALASSAHFTQTTAPAIHPGERIVFYGDSITDNGPYPLVMDMIFALRYPKWGITSINAGVGGDKVSGGWFGPIDQRLSRDLFANKPTLITVMLGMNDGLYQPFSDTMFKAYTDGYSHIADRFQKEAPNAKVWLIQPSPFDDVTRKPGWDPGYNSVILKLADYVKQLAAERKFDTVDFNSPMVDMLTKANATDPANAQKIIPDRIHPSFAGHLVMAAALFKAWNLSNMVLDVTVDSSGVTAAGGTAKKTGDNEFEIKEASLPLAVVLDDPLFKLVLASSDVEDTFNHEIFRDKALAPGNYDLTIDGTKVGTFSADQFADGINLAVLKTPMFDQANVVENLTSRIVSLRYNRWRQIDPLIGSEDVNGMKAADAGIQRAIDNTVKQREKAAEPVNHTFKITPAS